MDSELLEAIDVFETQRGYKMYPGERLIVKAAKKYANLHKSIDLDRLEKGLRFAHITDSDGEYLIYVAQEVTDALEIGEAPDGQ